MKFKIKSKKFKDKYIYGEISGVRGATTLVVFMSGFDGSSKFSLFKTATNYFNKNSVSTIRFDFCNKKNKDAILLQDISFSVYATELKNIIDRFGKNYLHIVFVGHSFGAVVAIMFLLKHKAFLKKTELVLWDPTLLPWKEVWMKEDYIFLPEKNFTATHILMNSSIKLSIKNVLILKIQQVYWDCSKKMYLLLQRRGVLIKTQ